MTAVSWTGRVGAGVWILTSLEEGFQRHSRILPDFRCSTFISRDSREQREGECFTPA